MTNGPGKSEKKDESMKIYIGGLTDILSDVSENELRSLFSPFGEIENIEVPRDHFTGKNKGYAHIVYCNNKDAREVIKMMDGFEINGKKIKVQLADTKKPHGDSINVPNGPSELDDESGAHYIHSA